MKLSELTNISVAKDFKVSKLCLDSRKCVKDSIFFAINGNHLNGESFIDSAIDKGARAIVLDKNSAFKPKDNLVEMIRVDDVQAVLADYCEKFFTDIPKNIVAVTGTNGKTSTACFVANIIAKLGKRSASIGTLGALIDGDFNKNIDESGLTTPDIITLYETLTKLKSQGAEYVCLEASSHGLIQNRLGNLKFDGAGFLNLSQDHLDYHKTMKEYFLAKKILFSNHLKTQATGILNADIDEFDDLKKMGFKYRDYGLKAKDIKIENITPSSEGLSFSINGRLIKADLIGEFQAYNLACAIGLVESLGFKFDDVLKACNGIKSVRGRMEVFAMGKQKAIAVVDYAHTPDALEKAINSVSKHADSRVITLFGCGGDRDKTKRPKMGKIANDGSDIVIVTDDNPRTEDANIIRKEILVACSGAIEVANRKDAIIKGLKMLQEGDVLLVAGKGHEDYQIIGDKKFHFSDAEVIKDYINS